jgi:hypothetical protein
MLEEALIERPRLLFLQTVLYIYIGDPCLDQFKTEFFLCNHNMYLQGEMYLMLGDLEKSLECYRSSVEEDHPRIQRILKYSKYILFYPI